MVMMRIKFSLFWIFPILCFGEQQETKRLPFNVDTFDPNVGVVQDVAVIYDFIKDMAERQPDVHIEMINKFHSTKSETDTAGKHNTMAYNYSDSFNHLPNSQLEQLRLHFRLAMSKLENMEHKLEEISGMIQDEDLKNHFIDIEGTIHGCLRTLNNYLTNPSSSFSKKTFLRETRKLANAILDLFNAMAIPNQSSLNILELIKLRENYHFNNFYRRTTTLLLLARTGLQVHAMLPVMKELKLNDTLKFIETVKDRNNQLIQSLRKIEKECQDEARVPDEILQFLQSSKEDYNAKEVLLARRIHRHLADKYSSKYWFVVVHRIPTEGHNYLRRMSDGFHVVLNVTLESKVNKEGRALSLNVYAISFSKLANLNLGKEIKDDLFDTADSFRALSYPEAASKVQKAYERFDEKYGRIARLIAIHGRISTHWEGIQPLCYTELYNVKLFCAFPRLLETTNVKSPDRALSKQEINVSVGSNSDLFFHPRVVGYATYCGNRPVTIQQAKFLTHIVFAYIETLADGTFRLNLNDTLTNAKAEEDRIKVKSRLDQLKAIKKQRNGRLKILFGISGWKNPTFFSEIVASLESQNRFIRNMKILLNTHLEFDGIDIDFGLPSQTYASTNQSTIIVNFLRKVRVALGELKTSSKRSENHLLTLAIPAVNQILSSGYNWKDITNIVDWMNIKSFDYLQPDNSKAAFTTPLAPLYPTAQLQETANVNYTILEQFTKAVGGQREKLVMGVPFYGRYWTNVNLTRPVSSGIFLLTESATGVSSNTGILTWKQLSSAWLNRKHYQLRSFSGKDSGSYLASTKDNFLVSFDGEDLLRKKRDFSRQHGLGGLMIWAIDMDSDCDTLLKAISYEVDEDVRDVGILLTKVAKSDEKNVSSKASQVRIVSGDHFSYGYVEVTIPEGITGFIGNKHWDDKHATVVCKQLGFTAGVATNSSYYQLPRNNSLLLVMDLVNCTGEESNILHCIHRNQQQEIHAGAEGLAGVACHKVQTFLSKVKLSGGNGISYGHVMVTSGHNGQSGYICDNSWDDANAAVVCRQLGFEYGVAKRGSHFGTVARNAVFTLDKVQCSGQERDILQCPNSGWKNHICGTGNAAGVICQYSSSPLSRVTLTDGNGVSYGYVMVTDKKTGQDSYISDSEWDDTAATVVCRQLGFRYGIALKLPRNKAFLGDTRFGIGRVKCTGNETDILQCSQEDALAIEAAGVNCRNHKFLNPAMVINNSPTCGNGYSSGVLMVSYGAGKHGPICYENWRDRDADSACQSLGFPGGRIAPFSDCRVNLIGPKTPVSPLLCIGNETSISKCQLEYYGCKNFSAAAVYCDERPVKPVEIKETPATSGYFFQNEGQRERFFQAAATGHLPSIQTLVDSGMNVNEKDSLDYESTALHKAARNGHITIVKYLLTETCASIENKDIFGWTPLHWAAATGEREVLQVLLRAGANVTAKDSINWTPLHHAAAHGQIYVIDDLLLAGASLDERDIEGSTPLHVTINGRFRELKTHLPGELEVLFQRAAHNEVVRHLLKVGAKIDAKDNRGWTPLHRAVYYGKQNLLDILLKAGAPKEARDNQGWTPLHWAAKLERSYVSCLLLKHGADMDSRTSYSKQTPRDIANGRDYWYHRICFDYDLPEEED